MTNPEMSPAWREFIRAVKMDVKPATGCTEPISLALASAIAASYLPGPAERVAASVSPNLMKNGMGVTVPGTGMVGLPVAAAVGATGGDPKAGLEVLKSATADAISAGKALLASGNINIVIQKPCDHILFAQATVYAKNESATVTIADGHTQVLRIEKTA